jgi:hypothetical protein
MNRFAPYQTAFYSFWIFDDIGTRSDSSPPWGIQGEMTAARRLIFMIFAMGKLSYPQIIFSCRLLKLLNSF